MTSVTQPPLPRPSASPHPHPFCSPYMESSSILSFNLFHVRDFLVWLLRKTVFWCVKPCRPHPKRATLWCFFLTHVWTCWDLGRRNFTPGFGLMGILSTRTTKASSFSFWMESGFLAKDAFEMSLFWFSKFSFEVEREAKPSCKQRVLFLIVFLFHFFPMNKNKN